jgi:hypothetical protein
MAFRRLTKPENAQRSTEINTSIHQTAESKNHGPILRHVLCGGKADEAKRSQEDTTIWKSDLDLAGKNIRDALEHMSKYLDDRKRNIDLVAIDSTFDTLCYTKYSETSSTPTRSTFEVEFLHLKHDNATYKVIYDAIEYARKITRVNLHGYWLQHQYSCPNGSDAERRMRDLVIQAKHQNETMFRRDGLTVYGAPWHFLFINKVVKICRRGIWASDAEYKDAVFFLRQYIYLKDNKIGSVRETDIMDWMDQYSLSTQGARADLDTVLADIASKYEQEYSEGGAIEQRLIDRANDNRWTLNNIITG